MLTYSEIAPLCQRPTAISLFWFTYPGKELTLQAVEGINRDTNA